MDNDEAKVQIIDRDQIDVFISCSMCDEGEFIWHQVRDELNQALAKSLIFKPFAIENHASIEKSTSYFLERLSQSDLVIGLIRSELRPGTNQELHRAIQLKKPLLLVKLGTETSPEIDSLFRYVRAIDACTYVEVAEAANLVPYLMNQLYNMMAELFHTRRYEIENDMASPFGGSASASVPKDVLDAFGSSASLLGKKFGYHAEWLEKKSDNPFFEVLGNKAVEWLLYGTPFTIAPYKKNVLDIMKSSGISGDTLSFRLDALDDYVNGRYANCFDKLTLACDSMSSKDSWLYGNCLIDKRNVAMLVDGQGVPAQLSIQRQIEAVSVPSYLPMALSFEEEAGTTTLKASREGDAINPYTTVRYDNSLASVLSSISCVLFGSLLYGSIASATNSRRLLANSLIDYSAIYGRPDLELEAIRLLVLQGGQPRTLKSALSTKVMVSGRIFPRALKSCGA